MNIKRIISIFMLLIIIILLGGCNFKNKSEYNYSESYATIYFFDVGQADSSLILFPDGKTMLIDAGNKADGEKISDFISDLGISNIDYFVCTHPHDDHIGGAPDIFGNFIVNSVYMPSISEEYLPKTKIYEDLIKSINDENCSVNFPTSSSIIIENIDYNVKVISPNSNSIFSDMNDYSLVLLVNCFTNTIIFTGDAEASAENDILNSNINIDADILKVGHHGSDSSSTEKFLKQVTPMVSIISCGNNNTYGHPNNSTLMRLNNIGSNIYRTDIVGTVIAKCYDKGFNIETSTDISLDGDR